MEKEKQNKLTKKDSLTDIERQDSSAKLVSTFRKVSGLASLLKKESSKIELVKKEKDILQKKIDLLTKMKDEAKKSYEEQIAKLQMDLAKKNFEFVNFQANKETEIIMYRNAITSIKNQCKSRGIILDIKY